MRRTKYVALPALAVAVVAAVTASAATSRPEWYKGGAPLAETTTVKFEGKSTSGSPTLESVQGNRIVCTSTTSKGEIVGPRTLKNVKVTFHGCKEGSVACNTANQAQETIVTAKLEGENDYLDTGHTTAGVLLKGSGGKFAVVKCGTSEIGVSGTVIAEATPLGGGDQTVGELTFAQENGKERWRLVEEAGEPQVLTAFGSFESGLGGGSTVSAALSEELKLSTALELHKS